MSERRQTRQARQGEAQSETKGAASKQVHPTKLSERNAIQVENGLPRVVQKRGRRGERDGETERVRVRERQRNGKRVKVTEKK